MSHTHFENLRHSVLFVAAVSLAGCSPSPTPAPEPAEPLNVILLVVDTLRADHLGLYGYHRDTSPNLDRFARQNVFFTQARSQASCTSPSVNSLLTSRHPVLFLKDQPFLGIPDDVPSLPEMLREAGYATAAVSASPIVRKSPSRFNPDGGFDRGFDHFNESCIWNSARCVNWAVANTLDALGHGTSPPSESEPREDPPPFFLYVHYMDPHGPYRPPDDFERRFSADSPDPTDGDPNVFARRIYEQSEEVDRAEILPLVDRYDDEIAVFDESFQVLLDHLDQLGLTESTLLVLTSDHGEEFLEHGNVKHCRNLFDTSILTPLVLRIPGVGQRPPVAVAAANLDIVPTILDYLDLPLENLEGVSLRGLIEGGDPAVTAVYSNQGRWRSLSTAEAKLIADVQTGSVTLYDLKRDPEEQQGISDRRLFPRRLVAELRRQRALEEQTLDREDAVRAAQRATEHLRELGYLQ